jgi:hypothetical protein
MAMTHDPVAPIRQLQSLPQGDKGIDFRNQHLSQHSAGAFTSDFRQVIVGGLGLTERNDSDISRHGVSLLSGGSGRLDTRLDTPPSTKRRHPDSAIAQRRHAKANAMPPRDPNDDDDEDEDEQDERKNDEPAVIREPDEDE